MWKSRSSRATSNSARIRESPATIASFPPPRRRRSSKALTRLVKALESRKVACDRSTISPPRPAPMARRSPSWKAGPVSMSISPATLTTVMSSAAARSNIEKSPLSVILNQPVCSHSDRHENSVLGRVFGHPGEQRVLTTLSLQDAPPKSLRFLREHVGRLRRGQDPVVAPELVVELTRAPAGVAREDAHVAGPVDHVRELTEPRH